MHGVEAMGKQFGLIVLGASWLGLPGIAARETWSATGPKGGMSEGTISCAHQTGTVTCARSAVYVSPKGIAVDRAANRVSAEGVTERTIVSTGPKGRSATVTRTRTRGN
jgi:hypothetical protein